MKNNTAMEVKSSEKENELQMQRTQVIPKMDGTKVMKSSVKRANLDEEMNTEKEETNTAKRKKSLENSPLKSKVMNLNPMLFYSRFQHITEKTFKNLAKILLRIAKWFLNHGKIASTIKRFYGIRFSKTKTPIKLFKKLVKKVI